MFIINCEKGCCAFQMTPYEEIVYELNDGWKEGSAKIKKAGCFIFDSTTNRLLLIQSRGKYFGFPKGSLNENENIQDGAIRELKEETGIEIDKEKLLRSILIKNNSYNSLYYMVDMKEVNVKPQNHIENNDANGIGWISLDCLKYMVFSKKIRINQHTRILIKKVFNINLVY
jgi:8-oxo-dGTP pyrophosphatase MutT (NUDIX family)